jgi:hypothetical protein
MSDAIPLLRIELETGLKEAAAAEKKREIGLFFNNPNRFVVQVGPANIMRMRG